MKKQKRIFSPRSEAELRENCGLYSIREIMGVTKLTLRGVRKAMKIYPDLWAPTYMVGRSHLWTYADVLRIQRGRKNQPNTTATTATTPATPLLKSVDTNVRLMIEFHNPISRTLWNDDSRLVLCEKPIDPLQDGYVDSEMFGPSLMGTRESFIPEEVQGNTQAYVVNRFDRWSLLVAAFTATGNALYIPWNRVRPPFDYWFPLDNVPDEVNLASKGAGKTVMVISTVELRDSCVKAINRLLKTGIGDPIKFPQYAGPCPIAMQHVQESKDWTERGGDIPKNDPTWNGWTYIVLDHAIGTGLAALVVWYELRKVGGKVVQMMAE